MLKLDDWEGDVFHVGPLLLPSLVLLLQPSLVLFPPPSQPPSLQPSLQPSLPPFPGRRARVQRCDSSPPIRQQ